MSLYLARFDLVTSSYPDGDKTYKRNQMRLIWANDDQEANDILTAEYDFYEIGSDSVHLDKVSIEVALAPKS